MNYLKNSWNENPLRNGVNELKLLETDKTSLSNVSDRERNLSIILDMRNVKGVKLFVNLESNGSVWTLNRIECRVCVCVFWKTNWPEKILIDKYLGYITKELSSLEKVKCPQICLNSLRKGRLLKIASEESSSSSSCIQWTKDQWQGYQNYLF